MEKRAILPTYMADNSSAARLAASDPIFGSPFEFLGLEDIKTANLAKGTAEAFFSASSELWQEVAGTQEKASKKGLPAQGEVKGFQTPNEQLRLMTIQSDLQTEQVRSRQKLITQQEIDMSIQGMSTSEKNKAMHISFDLDAKHIKDPYHVALLRQWKIAQNRMQQAAKKAGSIQVPKGKPKMGVDLEAQNEGGQGRGRAVTSSAVTAG